MKKIILCSLLTATTLIPLTAKAVDGAITFQGKITAQTCTINGNNSGSGTFNVPLPTDVSVNSLKTLNSIAGSTQFNIVLTGCTNSGGTAATKVYAYFEPNSNVDTNTGALFNTATTNSSVEVALSLNPSYNTPIQIGAQSTTQTFNIASGGATLTYYAQYLSTATAAAPVKAGPVQASVQYTLVYP